MHNTYTALPIPYQIGVGVYVTQYLHVELSNFFCSPELVWMIYL